MSVRREMSLAGVLPRIVHALKRRGHRKPIQCRVLLDAALPAAGAGYALTRAVSTSRTGVIGILRIPGILISRFRVPLTVVGPLAGAPVAGGVHHLVRQAGAEKALERGQSGALRLLRLA